MASVSQTNRQTPSAFGNLLKRLRVSANLTQEELAERAGVSTRLISDLERGVVRRSRRDTVEMLADGLKLDGTDRATFSALARRRQPPAGPTDEQPPPEPVSNLPDQPTPIIGREREISATMSILMQPETRLLTLTGPGGVGKTRLAIETASRASRAFLDGAVFVGLAPLADAGLVMPAIARALGLQGEVEEMTVDDISGSLEGRRLLLVLDNLEHLVDAALDIARLVERCPDCKVLATSRQLLRVRVEREYTVSPLALPDCEQDRTIESLGQSPAVRLFVERAETARPDFALTSGNANDIAAIVTRLDGLPLAIELAAARMRLLAPGDLLGRLDRSLPLLSGGPRDTPQRQQTLRATIDWSYNLLSPAEQRMFTWLSVFAGGFTLDAAEYLAGQMDMHEDALDTISSLAEKSLIAGWSESDSAGPARMPSRFRMFETIREYGQERLDDSDDRDEAHRQHARWCAELARQSEEGLNSPEQAGWLTWMLRENENIRAALTWSIRSGDAETAAEIAGWLLRFWVSSGQIIEARRWYEQVLALDRSSVTKARAKCLIGAQVITYFQGDYEASEGYGKEALRLHTELGDQTGIGSSYGNLGLVADAREDYDRATELYQQALSIFREIGDAKHIHFMLGNLGLITYFQGDLDRAAELLEESLTLSRDSGNHVSVAINLSNLGLVAFARNDFDRALELQLEALRLRISVQNMSGLGGNLDKIAAIAAACEDYERAVRLFGAGEGVRSEHGVTLQSNDREASRPHIERARRALGEDRFLALWAEGVSMTAGDAIEYALQFGSPTGQQSPPQPSQASGARNLAARAVETAD